MSDRVALQQRRANGIPSGRPSSGPLAKRLLTNPWAWAAVVLTLVYAACLYWQYHLITTPIQHEGGEIPALNYSAIRDATRLAFPTLAFWIVAYLLLDRFRPQRPLLWWLSLGWGGAVATAISMVLNTWAAEQMNISGQDPASGARAAIFVAPFVEEATKASVLFLIAMAYRYRLVSKLTGIVLAGLSAAGFAFTENIIYYARAIVYTSVTIGTGNPDEAVNKLVMLRGVWLAFGHPLFTTMTAIGLLTAVRTHSKVVRVLAPIVGYLCAALLHMLFNTGATLITAEPQQLLVYFGLVLPLVLSATIWILRQLLVEGRRLRDRLGDFVQMGWLSDADAYVFSRVRMRLRAARIAASRGWRTLLATLALQRAVTELAYLRDAQVRGTVDAAGNVRLRELLTQIEGLRASAVVDPRGQRMRWPDVRGWLKRIPLPRRRAALTAPGASELQPSWAPTRVSAPVGSPTYSPVDPRWGPPNP